MNTKKRNRKAFLPLLLIIVGFFSSCGNNEADTKTAIKDSTAALIPVKDTTITLRSADTAISHLQLKAYLPLAIPGFKTIGYPDTADRFTGEPTGETHSAKASGGPISFIKHLYKQNDAEIAVEIIDYKPAPDTYKGLFRMYDFDHMQHNQQEDAELISTGSPLVKAKQVFNKEEKTTTIHAFVCDRFIINVQAVNSKKANSAKDALKLVKIEQLLKDYCN